MAPPKQLVASAWSAPTEALELELADAWTGESLGPAGQTSAADLARAVDHARTWLRGCSTSQTTSAMFAPKATYYATNCYHGVKSCMPFLFVDDAPAASSGALSKKTLKDVNVA